MPKRATSPSSANPKSEAERKALEQSLSDRALIGVVTQGTKKKSGRIDPRITKLIKSGAPGQRLKVRVRLWPHANTFGAIPPSNDGGNERERLFSAEIGQLVGPVVTVTGKAANLGVATLEGPIEEMRRVVESPQLAGAQLLSND